MLEGITWFRQAAFRWKGDGLVVYVDPWGVTEPEPADLILITHAHYDHYQPHEIDRLRTSETKIVAPKDVPVHRQEVYEAIHGVKAPTAQPAQTAGAKADTDPRP